MKIEIGNYKDVIDSRDVISALEEIELEREEFVQAVEDAETEEEKTAAEDDLMQFDEERDYLALKNLDNDGEEIFYEWKEGTILIRESFFTEYIAELCADVGDLPRDLPWHIARNIDWEGLASDLQSDYSSIEFDGITYWGR